MNVIALAASALWLVAAPAADLPWYEHYQRGVDAVQRGQAAEARQHLKQAVRLHPEEGLKVRTEGARYVDYLPSLYLAMASHMTGDAAEARRYLAEAERLGHAAKSEVGKPLLQAWQLLLEDAGRAPSAPARPSKSYKDYTRKNPTLAEADFQKLRADVLSRCHLDTNAASSAPWYFHYELGIELEKRGDHQRALDAFIDAAMRRAQPARSARIYGMWFTDYMPYYQIARAHSALGNWECALDALRVSQQLDEISPDDEEFDELRALARDVEGKVGK